MTDKHLQNEADTSNMKKDPADWVTGDEPMTGAQKSYLKTLSEEAREPFDESLSKAEASRRIDELQARTGRRPPPPPDPADQGDAGDAAANTAQSADRQAQPQRRSGGSRS
jgi:hypothetical protein